MDENDRPERPRPFATARTLAMHVTPTFSLSPPQAIDPDLAIADDLVDRGWTVRADFLPPADSAALTEEARELWESGAFRHAGVGRGAELRIVPEIRGDRVRWLDPDRPSPAQRPYLERLEALRATLNRELCLGLAGFEGHLAVYPPGTFYVKHLDNFRGARHRRVSCILYLNPHWREGDGGELRLYTGPDGAGPWVDIPPRAGTLACFLSATVHHEVLPARRERFSLTGWLREREALAW